MGRDAVVHRLVHDPRVFVPVAASWGFAEATLFFIVPDVFVGLVALFDWRRGLAAAGAAVGGALIGGVLVFLTPSLFGPLLDLVPGIGPAMVAHVEAEVAAHGVWAMFPAAWTGLPFKIFAVALGKADVGLAVLALATLGARAGRIVPVALALSGIGRLLRRPLADRPTFIVGVYVTVWAVQYAAYYVLTYARFGEL